MIDRDTPRRFRGKPGSGFEHGCYFPKTDLVVSDMGQRGTGEPKDVEWLDINTNLAALKIRFDGIKSEEL